MKIIIPMTGIGSRFKASGYRDIKPLISIHKKPMISYVIDLFPGETDFLFLCREDHLEHTPLRSVLRELVPSGVIIPLEGERLGPVFPITQIMNSLAEEEPVIVSYCDYFMNWDYKDFKESIELSGCDGAIPCYTGFHPHLLHKKNVYAGCRVVQNRIVEIQEKHSFENDMTKGHHSAGLYYFQKAKYVKEYFSKLIDKGMKINGEYYVSMVYKLMLDDGKEIQLYDEIQHFCQWGTPEDLEEYIYWSNIMKER